MVRTALMWGPWMQTPCIVCCGYGVDKPAKRCKRRISSCAIAIFLGSRLDLKSNPLSQLRRIPTSTWHRFTRLLEQHRATVLSITPAPLITGVTRRVQIERRLGLENLSQSPEEIVRTLHFTWLRAKSTALQSTA